MRLKSAGALFKTVYISSNDRKSEHSQSTLRRPESCNICISSESCLGSIVGFARLPCFGTLRFAISAKVELGEPLRLCPDSSGLSTSVEKAKTDCHDKARAGHCSRGLESLKTYAT